MRFLIGFLLFLITHSVQAQLSISWQLYKNGDMYIFKSSTGETYTRPGGFAVDGIPGTNRIVISSPVENLHKEILPGQLLKADNTAYGNSVSTAMSGWLTYLQSVVTVSGGSSSSVASSVSVSNFPASQSVVVTSSQAPMTQIGTTLPDSQTLTTTVTLDNTGISGYMIENLGAGTTTVKYGNITYTLNPTDQRWFKLELDPKSGKLNPLLTLILYGTPSAPIGVISYKTQ